MVLEKFKQLDIDRLSISDYNKTHLKRIQENADYYIDIYQHCLDLALASVEKDLKDVVMVDYGGGHGLLSIIAKEKGIGNVIYIDINPSSVTTANILAKECGFCPDIMLAGDSTSLKERCTSTSIDVDILLGMDVIEHIYCLDDFFADIFQLSKNLKCIFTTSSTPYNKRIIKRLRKVMIDDEKIFYELRKDYIQTIYPDFEEKNLDYWARNTRGLIYADINKAIEAESANILTDEYNTCDPRNGSWTERILPLEDYFQIVNQYGYGMTYHLGYHNTYRQTIKGILSRLENFLIKMPGGKKFAPWIILEITKQ